MHPLRQVETRPIGSLKPHPRNVRIHPNKQIDLLTKNIDQFGVTTPPLVDENDVILAGHARWEAAKKLGLTEIPAIVLRGLTDAKKRAYALADNRLAELAGTDRLALADELQKLPDLLAAEGLDIALTGYEPAQIDALFADLVDQIDSPEDQLPALTAKAVTRLGDIWEFRNRHRLLCGDARKPTTAR